MQQITRTEILREDYPAMDMSWDYYARKGDQRNDEHAVRVITTADGRVSTHFARPYTPGELAAISEFEKIYDC